MDATWLTTFKTYGWPTCSVNLGDHFESTVRVLVQFETPTLADYLILKLLKSRTFMIVAIDNLKNRKLSNALQIVYDYSETICRLWIPPNIELHRWKVKWSYFKAVTKCEGKRETKMVDPSRSSAWWSCPVRGFRTINGLVLVLSWSTTDNHNTSRLTRGVYHLFETHLTSYELLVRFTTLLQQWRAVEQSRRQTQFMSRQDCVSFFFHDFLIGIDREVHISLKIVHQSFSSKAPTCPKTENWWPIHIQWTSNEKLKKNQKLLKQLLKHCHRLGPAKIDIKWLVASSQLLYLSYRN